MIKTDYHMHTDFSNDSPAPMESMVQRALSLGLKEIALTDHVDYSFPEPNHMHPIDYSQYLEEFNRLKEKYKNQIHLLFGVEIGVTSRFGKEIDAFINSLPFEFVIGSLHDYNGVDFYYPNFYEGRTKKEAYSFYFDEIMKSAKAIESFYVVGHLDYIERYGRYEDKSLQYGEFQEVIDETLKTIIQTGKGIEINTSGIRYKLGHTHPQIEILKAYKKFGGEIVTVGSDAHRPEHIALDFDVAKDMLLEAGFKAMTVFRDKKPVMVDL